MTNREKELKKELSNYKLFMINLYHALCSGETDVTKLQHVQALGSMIMQSLEKAKLIMDEAQEELLERTRKEKMD